MHLDVLPKTIDSVRGVSSDCICFSSDVGLPLLVAFLFPMMMQTNRKFPALMISAADHCVCVRGMPVEAVAVRQHTATVRVCPFEPIDPLEHHIEALTILKSGAVPLLLFSRNCLLLRMIFRFPTVSSSGSKM